MFVMNKYDYSLLTALLKMRQNTLFSSMKKYLRKYFDEEDIIADKSFIFAKGQMPILLVAHLDTVFETPPSMILYDQEKYIMWSPNGLGADDRAGVFSILKILSFGYRHKPSVLFTTDEEIGNYGTNLFLEQYPNLPIDLKYIIQLDRQGYEDCVFYNCDNKEFQTYVEGFGFKTDIGSFTDISDICPAWDIAGVNLSVGYIGEHTRQEFLNTHAMYSTIHKVCKMLEDSHNIKNKFKYIRKTKPPFQIISYKNSDIDHNMYDCFYTEYDDEYENYEYKNNTPLVVKCAICNKEVPTTHSWKIEGEYYCNDCLNGGLGHCIKYCKHCDLPYFNSHNDNGYCQSCRDRGYDHVDV